MYSVSYNDRVCKKLHKGCVRYVVGIALHGMIYMCRHVSHCLGDLGLKLLAWAELATLGLAALLVFTPA